MADEVVLDPVTEALREMLLRELDPDRDDPSPPEDLIALVECYRGVREDDRLLKLEAAVGALSQQVAQMRGNLGGSDVEDELAQLGRRLG